MPKEAPPIKATMEVEIPGPVFEEFVLFVFNCPDFLCYIDHWAAPVYENDVQCANEEGLLIVERDEVEEDDETSIIKAVKAWRAKKKLPRYFHAITREVCLKAYLEGVRLYGVKWHEHPDCDMHTYDMAFQHALLPSNRWAY